MVPIFMIDGGYAERSHVGFLSELIAHMIREKLKFLEKGSSEFQKAQVLGKRLKRVSKSSSTWEKAQVKPKNSFSSFGIKAQVRG